uniref:UDP-glucose 4-epimerase n=1 Tax=Amphimedon queenslandica TaxID=400682 RepID=A0A1X7U165_AMPQE
MAEPAPRYVLLSGGAGYIGSHTLIEMLESSPEYAPVVVDNLYNASRESITRIEALTGKKVPFYDIDLTKDPATSGLDDLFTKYSFHSVINFAGMKAVGESMKIPLEYYSCNLSIVFNLLAVMKKHGVKNFVFSSTACVYGEPQYLPIDESHPCGYIIPVCCFFH